MIPKIFGGTPWTGGLPVAEVSIARARHWITDKSSVRSIGPY
jgi:hypothetical protein